MPRRRIFQGNGRFRAGLFELLRSVDWRTWLATIATGSGGTIISTLLPWLLSSSTFWSIVFFVAPAVIRFVVEWIRDNRERQIID